MSIASELITLAANKAAIKSAIEAKSPVTAPTDALSQWPTAIASIPTGSSLSDIITATEDMDGLDHTGATVSDLASAIKQITRRGTRRSGSAITPPSIPAIEGYENGSAFAITVTQEMIDEDSEGRGGFTFGFYGITIKSGHSSYSVHWGDGTQNTGLNVSVNAGLYGATCLGNTGSSSAQTGTNGTVTDGTAEVCHTYSTPGTYVIQISDDINCFGMGGNYAGYGDPFNSLVSANKPMLATRVRNARYAVTNALRWGNGVTLASGTYASCVNLRSLCAWNDAITSADSTYYNCTGLTGTIPAWNSVTTNMFATYARCAGLTGTIPAWNTVVRSPNITYAYCTGLTGSIPPWNSVTTNANGVYQDCTGLTGSIPAWGPSMKSGQSTYYNCTGLSGTIPAWGAEMTSAYHTYENCSGLTGSIPAWAPTITIAPWTYGGCTGLTGTIPAWNSVVTEVNGTYVNCTGLSGTIPAWGSAITNAAGTYNGCTGLSGTIPAWNTVTTNGSSTYQNCSGLTGNIPAWGSAITQATNTYNACIGLTGVWNSSASDAELMPSAITAKGNCVAGCHPYLRQYFLTTWGGTRAS